MRASSLMRVDYISPMRGTIEQENGDVPPDLIGHDFKAIGTMDLADWGRSRNKPYTIQQLQACLYPLRQERSEVVWRFQTLAVGRDASWDTLLDDGAVFGPRPPRPGWVASTRVSRRPNVTCAPG